MSDKNDTTKTPRYPKKYVLTFVHMKFPVVSTIGTYDTLYEAQNTLGIGKGMYEWEGKEPHWTFPAFDLGFYAFINHEEVKPPRKRGLAGFLQRIKTAWEMKQNE